MVRHADPPRTRGVAELFEFDPLRLAIAFIPLSAYLLMLALMNLGRRPVLVSGANDLAALGAALSGLAFVGPIELFRPEIATANLGAYVWVLLLGLYWLAVSLVAMVLRPSLVIYNITLEELRPALAEAVTQVDPEARWAGDSLRLPRLGVQLHLDEFPLMRHVTLASSGHVQDLGGWYRLRRALDRSLSHLPVRPNPRSITLAALAVLMFAVSLGELCIAPVEVAQAVSELISF